MDADANPVDSDFFDTLWPLILNENKCELVSESKEYFVPCKPFDQIHWHGMLSKVGYPGYATPDDLHCCGAAKREEEQNLEAVKEVDAAAEQPTAAALMDYENCGSLGIKPVYKQVKQLRKQRERRQKLAYNFANRKYPWTMQTPSHETGFMLTAELKRNFQCQREMQMLEAIYRYNCKLMLIDCSSEICVEDVKRWIKFRPYVQMLVMVRCPRVERHIQLLNVFHTLLVEESALNTWHQELQCSLRAGLKEARQRELFKNCAEAFVFVFSRYRGICTCDTYKILRSM
ncbi:uncharacterized protein LOC117575072 [Drosophila albomicans]|uniref:Uncharacterized protein LOC117575072 n=1 Tax=Drosophila albomicans TaxID=7291 RepID=A0A6P8XPR9_DROAB|nr:uncharacterized protein LOC117575072 [Drosophila albomicans]